MSKGHMLVVYREIMWWTLFFDKYPEGPSLSFDLVFHPSPEWHQGEKIIGAPRNDNPRLTLGFVSYLIEEAEINKSSLNSMEVYLVWQRGGLEDHYRGHGDETDGDVLVQDLENNGFTVIGYTI